MQPGYPSQPPEQINNNMTMSIVSIFLFWPLAIPALINAAKVNPLLQQGDYAGAQAAAAESRKWSKLALIIGLIVWAISLVCCIAGFAMSMASTVSAVAPSATLSVTTTSSGPPSKSRSGLVAQIARLPSTTAPGATAYRVFRTTKRRH